jgi:hypothetical protein
MGTGIVSLGFSDGRVTPERILFAFAAAAWVVMMALFVATSAERPSRGWSRGT